MLRGASHSSPRMHGRLANSTRTKNGQQIGACDQN